MKIRKESSRCKTLEDFINLGLNFQYVPIKGLPFKQIFRTLQDKYEITEFIKEVASLRPKLVLEIGTARGGTLFLLTQFSSADAHIISLDLPGGIHGGGYPRFKILFYKFFVSRNQKLSLIRNDSHKLASLNKIKKLLKNRKLDLLFIDGDHTYDGVKKDYDMYSPLVRKNGFIAFHDIVTQPLELNCHVDKLWNKIKNKFEYKEIINETEQHKLGIGLMKI